MKKTPRSKIASLYQFWTAQDNHQSTPLHQQRQQRPNHAVSNDADVITLSDSPMEYLNITPLSKTATPDPPEHSVPCWAPLARHSTTSDPSSSHAHNYVPTAMRHVSPASEAELKKAGFDPYEGTSLMYPVNESLRGFEVEIVKSCVSHNCAVSLPMAVAPGHICSVVFINFLRWFPRSRAVFCCNSLDAAQIFEERCISVGIPSEEVSKIDTFQTFKKIPDSKITRVMITTPQALEKIVESESALIADIRCIVFCLDASENMRITKYKNIVGTLTVKGIIFRVILVTPSVPSTSNKLAPLRRRQQIITSLIISRWIEILPSDLVFRNNSIPLGISVDYCTNVEVLLESRSFINKWLEKVPYYLSKLNELISLPSTEAQELFTLDWTPMIAKATLLSDDTLQLLVNCMFLVEAARNLIIHGPRVFYLYCIDLLSGADKDTRADNILLMILGDEVLCNLYDNIQARYSYNADFAFDISFNKLSLSSHPKYSRLRKILDKFPPPLRCLVLCENEFVSRVVCESIETTRFRDALVRILNKGSPHFTSVVDTICSNQLNVVVSMDRRSICLLEGHTGEHIAILDAEYEKLRSTDGRLMKVTDEVACRRSSLFGKSGAIERYNFSYELSRLQLHGKKMEFVQYIPNLLQQATAAKQCARRQGFELTSAEYSEYCDQLASLPVVPKGLYSRKRRFMLLGEPPDIKNEPYIHAQGNIQSGMLSKRLVEYLKGGDLLRRRVKRQFEYSEELIEKERIKFYEEMIEKLSGLLEM